MEMLLGHNVPGLGYEMMRRLLSSLVDFSSPKTSCKTVCTQGICESKQKNREYHALSRRHSLENLGLGRSIFVRKYMTFNYSQDVLLHK